MAVTRLRRLWRYFYSEDFDHDFRIFLDLAWGWLQEVDRSPLRCIQKSRMSLFSNPCERIGFIASEVFILHLNMIGMHRTCLRNLWRRPKKKSFGNFRSPIFGFFRISIVGFLIIFRKFSNLENFGSRFLKLHRTDHFQTFGGVHNGYKHHRNGCDTLAKAMAVFLLRGF